MMIVQINYLSKRFIRGPNPIRWAIKAVLIPLWYVGQCGEPFLENLDRNWSLESTSGYAMARKP